MRITVRLSCDLLGVGCTAARERVPGFNRRQSGPQWRDMSWTEGPRLLKQFEQLFGRVQRPMRERSLKEMTLRHHKCSRSEVDHRSKRRPDWDSYLSE